MEKLRKKKKIAENELKNIHKSKCEKRIGANFLITCFNYDYLFNLLVIITA